MSTQSDLKPPVLCIPRVYANIKEPRIRKIFEDLNIGILDHIDIVNKSNDKNKKDKFNRVYIHLKCWAETENGKVAKERLLNGKEIKVIYDDPWFWKVSAYKEIHKNSLKKQHF